MRSKLATEKIGDAAVAARTGRTWGDWFRILDKAGASKMGHREIVAVARRHGAGDWWAQMVTVGYEQERGLRAAHEKPDGFEVSASRTIAAPVSAVYRAWTDVKRRDRWMPGVRFALRRTTANKSLRVDWDDQGSRVEVIFLAKGGGRSQLTVQHRRLPSASVAERTKRRWRARLDDLRALLEKKP